MSKTKEAQQNPIYDELLKNGTTVLKAKTREELTKMVGNIPAEVKYMVGAVGRNDYGEYTLQVDII
jgi:hypothetical protein